MTARQLKTIAFAPVLAWIGLLVTLAVTVFYAYQPGAPAKAVASLAIAGIKASLIAVVFMRLDRSAMLIRLTAAVGFLWLSLLFIMAFADYMTRH